MKFYGTFGVGTPLGKYHLVIYAKDMQVARAYISGLFNGKFWCGVYDEKDAKVCVLDYGTEELKLPESLATSELVPAEEYQP